jgi:hypothetical protein
MIAGGDFFADNPSDTTAKSSKKNRDLAVLSPILPPNLKKKSRFGGSIGDFFYICGIKNFRYGKEQHHRQSARNQVVGRFGSIQQGGICGIVWTQKGRQDVSFAAIF